MKKYANTFINMRNLLLIWHNTQVQTEFIVNEKMKFSKKTSPNATKIMTMMMMIPSLRLTYSSAITFRSQFSGFSFLFLGYFYLPSWENSWLLALNFVSLIAQFLVSCLLALNCVSLVTQFLGFLFTCYWWFKDHVFVSSTSHFVVLGDSWLFLIVSFFV